MRRCFSVTLRNEDLNLRVHGITANLSQYGAFIRIETYHSLRAGTPTTITLFLPPEFTGQSKLIGLQGEAVISRVDEASASVAVEFCKALRQFERVDVPDQH